MKQGSIIEFLYGGLLIVGGIMGYKHANSIPSLISGVFAGILMILLAIEMIRGKTYASYLACLLALGLTIFFGYRFATHYGFHTIALALISAFVAIIIFIKITKITKVE